MAPTYHDPAERGYLRLFYRDWHPTRLGKLATGALAWVSGLGLTPQVLLTLQVRGRRSGPAPRYCPGSRQAQRAALLGVYARRRFGVGAQRPRHGRKGFRQARPVTPCAAHRSPGRGTRPSPEGVLPSRHEWPSTLPGVAQCTALGVRCRSRALPRVPH